MPRIGSHTVCRALALAALAPACHPVRGPEPIPAPAPAMPPVPEPPPVRELRLDEVPAHLRPLHRDVVYAEPTPDEHAVVSELVTALLEGPAEPWMEQKAARIGFTIERWRVAGEDYAALIERADRRRGAGTYVFRAAPTGDPVVVLQAPHAYFDRGTRDIAARAFFAAPERARLRALFVNSVHRYQLGPGVRERRARNPADVAHNASHLFSTATVAAARAAGRICVFQLHGFADGSSPADVILRSSSSPRATAAPVLAPGAPVSPESPESPDAPGALAPAPDAPGAPAPDAPGALAPAPNSPVAPAPNSPVAPAPNSPVEPSVSPAPAPTTATLDELLAVRLADSFADADIRRFPAETSVLGGERNAQRRLLLEHPGAVFVHIELARRFRRYLLGYRSGGDDQRAAGTSGGDGRATRSARRIDAFADALFAHAAASACAQAGQR